MPETSPYKIETLPDKGVLIAFDKGDVHQLPNDQEKAELLNAVQKTGRTVLDLSATGRIGTRWLAWFTRMTDEAESGGGQVFVVGADPTTKKTADQIAAQLSYAASVDEAWNK